MRTRSISVVFSSLLALIAPMLSSAQDLFSDGACVVPDGPVPLPPEDCGYLAPAAGLLIIDGLPPGSTIEIMPLLQGVHCAQDNKASAEAINGIPVPIGPCLVSPSTGLGGQQIDFHTVLVMDLRGTGDLAGFHRIIPLTAFAQWDTGPRDSTQPVQAFPTDIIGLSAFLAGDLDFDTLQVTAGSSFGLPSPGMATLTAVAGSLHVDSFFDITYNITFTGAPGGALEGLSGSTMGVTRVDAAATRRPCHVPDQGTGTVALPPSGCDQRAAGRTWMIVDGLPPGTTIELTPRLTDFVCMLPTGTCEEPGGSLSGTRQVYSADLSWHLRGTGALADFRRTLHLPVVVEAHAGPRVALSSVQALATELISLSGGIHDDPDFAELTVLAGSGNGLPSPGVTVLEDRGDASWSVDSFFDVAYQIDFVGAPGGVLEGLSGTTSGNVPSVAREGTSPPSEPDNGTGTATLPPESAAYEGFEQHYLIVDGLPAGTTIEVVPSHRLFFCDLIPCAAPLPDGGNREDFSASAVLELTGTGSLVGFHRMLTLPLTVETESDFRLPGQAVQPFDTEIVSLQGILVGDPDFDQLLLTAGLTHALPSPGHTTLTNTGGGQFQVDSFFDIAYRIDFVGAPGGMLDGLSGSSSGTLSVTAIPDPTPTPRNISIVYETRPKSPEDITFTGDLGSFTLDDDSDPALSNVRRFFNLLAGTYLVAAPVPAGRVALGIECDDPDAGTSFPAAGSEVLIDLDLGESITCTFIDGTDDLFASSFEGVAPDA